MQKNAIDQNLQTSSYGRQNDFAVDVFFYFLHFHFIVEHSRGDNWLHQCKAFSFSYYLFFVSACGFMFPFVLKLKEFSGTLIYANNTLH